VLHTVLIAVHAAAGLVALVAGGLALQRRRPFGLYFWSLAACLGALAAVVAVDRGGPDTSSRVLSIAFLALGGFMLWRAVQARRLLAHAPDERSPRYLDHLGFTLVALLDAFVVIAVLDVSGLGWLAAVVGVAGAGAGHRALASMKRRLGARAPDEATDRAHSADG
jgi:hypothetical protein